MKNTPDITKINEALDKLLSHHIFVKSPRNARLLKFLVEQAMNGVDIKEHIIGVELFQNNYNPDKNDGRVRVYMFNLRKKLDEYYAEINTGNEVVFKIEKGQYNVHFGSTREVPVTEEKITSKSVFTQTRVIVLCIIVLIVTALVFIFYPKNNVYCWQDFFSPKAKNICVIADHQIIEKKQESGKWLPVIISGVNSEYELAKYVSDHEITDLRAADYTMMTKMAPYALRDLQNWFNTHGSSMDILLESDFRLEETRNHNIIYVGQYKTMVVSKGLFLKDSEVFSSLPDGFLYKKGVDEVRYITQNSGDGNKTEYAMVSYIPMDNGNKALFLTSNHDIGAMATVRNFTNQEWLNKFYKEIPKGVKYFNALFEVNGVRRTDMSCKLIEFEVLEY